jgi:hypothetical protein
LNPCDLPLQNAGDTTQNHSKAHFIYFEAHSTCCGALEIIEYRRAQASSLDVFNAQKPLNNIAWTGINAIVATNAASPRPPRGTGHLDVAQAPMQ